MVLCTTRQYQQVPKRGRLRELHCTLACDWATGNTRSWPKKASTTDIQSGPRPSLGENLDGARRWSRLTQFPRFTHKPRRPGDYRLHHVTTSWAHSVLQRPQQASATRGLLAATGCAAGSFTQKAWQYAQNEPHLPVQSLWELKPDLSEIRGASNYWHVQTEPPPRWCLSCCV